MKKYRRIKIKNRTSERQTRSSSKAEADPHTHTHTVSACCAMQNCRRLALIPKRCLCACWSYDGKGGFFVRRERLKNTKPWLLKLFCICDDFTLLHCCLVSFLPHPSYEYTTYNISLFRIRTQWHGWYGTAEKQRDRKSAQRLSRQKSGALEYLKVERIYDTEWSERTPSLPNTKYTSTIGPYHLWKIFAARFFVLCVLFCVCVCCLFHTLSVSLNFSLSSGCCALLL